MIKTKNHEQNFFHVFIFIHIEKFIIYKFHPKQYSNIEEQNKKFVYGQTTLNLSTEAYIENDAITPSSIIVITPVQDADLADFFHVGTPTDGKVRVRGWTTANKGASGITTFNYIIMN